ncbi:MAG: regulatory protein MarR [Gemmatimonadetes bacterium]|nr:regulatory protein MarR [Gemmatimonadota bacterium]
MATGKAGPPRDDSARRVMDGLRRIVRALSTSAREVAPRGSVSGAQLFVLRQVGASPEISMGALAASTLAKQSTISEVVSRLVKAGLVARVPAKGDARVRALTLTARGRRIVARAGPTVQERLLEGLGAMTPRQRAALAAALEQWITDAGLGRVPATMLLEEE